MLLVMKDILEKTKRLKYTQKLTESNRYDDIRENLNDILYEAQDLGYETKVDTYSSGNQEDF